MRLEEMNLLRGQSEEISMTDLRSRPGDIISQVQMGKTFHITKAGKKVATLGAYELNALELGAAARIERRVRTKPKCL